MTVTTSYGSWNRWVPSTLSLHSEVVGALNGEYDDKFVERVTYAYRDAINAALPRHVDLCGDEFYGPHHDRDCDFDGYPTDENGSLDIGAIIESVDFWALVEGME